MWLCKSNINYKIRVLFLLVACSLFLVPALFAQDSLNCRFSRNWPFGRPYAVAYDASRHLAFYGSGGDVYIIDRYTGRINYCLKTPHTTSLRAKNPILIDTINIKVYPLNSESTIVWPHGIDIGQEPSKIWFLATWVDTFNQTFQDYLTLLDATTVPGIDSVATVHHFAVTPEVHFALYSTQIASPWVSVVNPVTRPLPTDTFGGMRRWLTDGLPFNLDAEENIWFTESDSSKIACFIPSSGTITEWSTPYSGFPIGIRSSEDTIWYTEPDGILGRVVPSSNEFTEWIVPGQGFWGVGWPGLDIDANRNIWLTRRRDEHFLARVNIIAGNIARFEMWTLPYQLADGPCDLIVDNEGKVWYSVMGVDSNNQISKIGRLDPATNVLTEWLLPTPYNSPYYLELDENGICWFVEADSNRVGKINPNTNIITEYSPLITCGSIAYDLALDSRGNVWFSHGGSCIIQLINIVGIEEERYPPSALRSPLKIYPNPVSSVARVRSPFAVKEIKIYNVAGKMVRVEEFNCLGVTELKLSLKGIKPGVYFLQLNNEPETKKLVITK